MEIWLVEMSGTAVRAFADKDRAQKYINCLMREWDEELDEPRYDGYEFQIVPSYLEK